MHSTELPSVTQCLAELWVIAYVYCFLRPGRRTVCGRAQMAASNFFRKIRFLILKRFNGGPSDARKINVGWVLIDGPRVCSHSVRRRLDGGSWGLHRETRPASMACIVSSRFKQLPLRGLCFGLWGWFSSIDASNVPGYLQDSRSALLHNTE